MSTVLCPECHHRPSMRDGDPAYCYCRCHDVADAAPALLAAITGIFPPEDWQRYEGSPLAGHITVELTVTREELIALRDAIIQAGGLS